MQCCHVRWLGLVPYQQAWDLQIHLAGQIAAGVLPPTLLLLEHPHTITFGRRGQAKNLLWSEIELKQRGINVFWVDRGGDVTYHGPGQLVGYPLIPLNIGSLINAQGTSLNEIPHADYIGYVRNLEQVLIHALHQFGVNAERLENLTGVWVNNSKIAAIGVKVDAHGISRHGFALNVAPDMSYWDAIIGCGLADHSVTCLAHLISTPPSMEDVVQAIVSSFGQVFGMNCQMVT